NVSALVARLARFYYRVASCNSQRDLWLVGHLYSCPITQHLRGAFLSTLLRLDWLVCGATVWHRHAGGWNYFSDHGHPDCFVNHTRGYDRRPATTEGSR